jgi:OmpA-OmpF porin, OOP family
MRKLFLCAALGMSALISSNTSRAEDFDFYARASIGNASLTNSVYNDSNSDFGLGGAVGWRFIPWLAVEAGYSQLGEYAFDCGPSPCPTVRPPALELDTVELGLAARLPFGDSGWFGQLRSGLHHWDGGFGRSDTDPYYGIGFGYQFNDRFNMSLNYDHYKAGDVNVNRVGLGLEVAF